MLKLTYGIIGIFALSAACAPAKDDGAASSAAVVKGTDIHSPYANPSATYLNARRIDNLKTLGALPGVLTELAQKVDQPAPDGRISIDELVALNLQSLLPAERTVLPALWHLLECASGDPSTFTIPDVDTITVVDVSDAATTPQDPATITVQSLKADFQRSAERLEQLHDDDGDPKTISEADIDAGVVDPSYQAFEVAQMKAMKGIFRDRAGTKLAAKAKVTKPVDPPYSLPQLSTWGPASLGLSKIVEYTETRQADSATGNLVTTLTGHAGVKAVASVPNADQVLMVDDSGAETFVASGDFAVDPSTKTVEVWSGGDRIGSFRVAFPKIAPKDASVDLTKYVDFKLVKDDGKSILRYPITDSGSINGTVTACSFRFNDEGYGYVADDITARVATPSSSAAFGRYVLPAADGNVTVELYPEGVVKVTRANGWTGNAIYRNNRWVLPSSDLSFSFDPDANHLTVKRADGTTIFDGPLTGSLRTG
jgi:hypothetical protein